jgi:hypothetical protein
MLIRDYFPKGTDFNLISAARTKAVQNQLNTRHRKTLDWRTPKEVFDQSAMTEEKQTDRFTCVAGDWKPHRTSRILEESKKRVSFIFSAPLH